MLWKPLQTLWLTPCWVLPGALRPVEERVSKGAPFFAQPPACSKMHEVLRKADEQFRNVPRLSRDIGARFQTDRPKITEFPCLK